MICRLGDRIPVFEGENHYVADSASVIGSVTLKSNTSIWFNAVVRADNDRIEIGRNSNIQDGAVLHTDTDIPLIVGEGVTVGHRAMLHGCVIGNNSLIGIGSTILNHASIGENCVVGANSLITEGKSFPAGSLIMGSPAKAIRALNDEEKELIRAAANSYVDKGGIYRDELSECTTPSASCRSV